MHFCEGSGYFHFYLVNNIQDGVLWTWSCTVMKKVYLLEILNIDLMFNVGQSAVGYL